MSDDEPSAKETETTSDNNFPPHDASIDTPEIPQDNSPRPSMASSPPILPPVGDIFTTIEGNGDETSQSLSESNINPPPYPVTPPPKPAPWPPRRVEVPSSPPAGPKPETSRPDTAEDADDSTIPATPDPAEVQLPSSPPRPSAAGQKRRAEDVDTGESTKFVRLEGSEAGQEGGVGGPSAGQTPTEFTNRLQREKSRMEPEKSMEVSADGTGMQGVEDGKVAERDATGDDSDASTIVQEAKSGKETSSPNVSDALMGEKGGHGSAAED